MIRYGVDTGTRAGIWLNTCGQHLGLTFQRDLWLTPLIRGGAPDLAPDVQLGLGPMF